MRQLEDLLQQCTVKLSIPGQLGWGTGFFVAPGLILTCAHVVKALVAPNRVRVRWQQQVNFAEAELVHRVPDLDLALLQFTPGDADLPCVYLDEGLQAGQDLYFFGYPDEDFEHGCPVTGSCEGLTGDVSPLIKFKQAQVRPGMSGSALLNRQTRKVCGMVKFTRDRKSDLGGGAIPTRVILEQFPELRELQRAFHRGDKHWSQLISVDPPKIDFQPYLRSLIANEKYRQKWEFYTPTDATGKIQPPKAVSELDIGLMVQLMQPKQREGDRTPEQEEKTERLPVLEGIRKYAADHVLLMGRPGSGKSTALLRLLVEEANQALADPSARIPVLVELRYLDADQPSVLERIEAFLRSHDLDLESASLKQALMEGRLLLLVDGVNELPSEPARHAVARFRQDYPKTPMVFTTRDVALGGDLGIEKKLEMQPLSEAQMRQFVQAYLPEQGEPMLRQLQGRLREVGQTPLLLWMLCQVFQGLQQIPSSPGLLFRWFAREYDKLKRDVPVAEGLRHWQSELLQHLAFTMLQTGGATDLRVDISRPEAEAVLSEFLTGKVDYPTQRAKEWLEDLLEHHLIQPTSQNQLEFHHQLIQEYYAAEYLLKLLPTLTDDQLKRDYLNYLKWTEPISLMLALEDKETQAMRVVRLAMDEVDLMLGARLAGEVRPTFQATTSDWIGMKTLPTGLKVKLWEASSEAGIAGLLSSNWVLNDSDSGARQNAVEALGKIGGERMVDALLSVLNDSDSGARQNAVEALGRIGDERAVDGLLSALNDSDFVVRQNAAAALGIIGDERAVDGLLGALNDLDSGVRQNAAAALGKIGGERMVDGLLDALNDSDSGVRRRAVEALEKNAAEVLGKIGDERVVDALLSALNDSDSYVCTTAAMALAIIGDERVVDSLLSKLNLNTPYHYPPMTTLEALKRLGSARSLADLWRFYRLADFWQFYDMLSSCSFASSGGTALPDDVWHAISAIQNRCQFYNYEIFQAHLATQKADLPTNPNSSNPGINGGGQTSSISNGFGTATRKQVSKLVNTLPKTMSGQKARSPFSKVSVKM